MKKLVTVARFYAFPLALCLTIVACQQGSHISNRPSRGDGSPTIQLVSQIDIKEPDSLLLATPRFLAFSDDGDFWIADGYYERVVRYNRKGLPESVLGRKGSGPGEFRSVGLILPLANGRVAIADNALRRLSFFDQTSDNLISAMLYNGIIYHGQADGSGIWLGDLNMERRTGVARADGRDTSLTYLVPVPVEYELGGPLAGIYDGVSIAAWADTLLVAFAASNRILVLDTLGHLRDSLDLPKRLRRGVPSNVQELFGPEHQLSQPDMFAALSEFYALHRLPDGRILAAHRDGNIKDGLVTTMLYVSILTSDLLTACVDALIPLSGDSPVVAAFKGDTVFVLDQAMDSTSRLTATLRGFVVNDTDCEWQTTRR